MADNDTIKLERKIKIKILDIIDNTVDRLEDELTGEEFSGAITFIAEFEKELKKFFNDQEDI